MRQGALKFFAKYQRADGKITHEISQGAGHVDWFDYPYPYYHGDTTPFWMLAFGEYWRQTADTALVQGTLAQHPQGVRVVARPPTPTATG